MSRQLSEFTVKNLSAEVSWYMVYASIRQYGAIVKVSSMDTEPCSCAEQCTGSCTRNALFQLPSTDTTNELKTLGEINCDSVDVPIEWKRDIVTKSDQPTNARDGGWKNFLEIVSNDCILDIFDYEVLDARDLCALALIDSRIEETAERAFRTRFGKSTISISGAHWSPAEIEMLCLTFGRYITAIDVVDDTPFGDIILGFIGRHCPNVEKLSCPHLGGLAETIDNYECLSFKEQSLIASPFGRVSQLKCCRINREIRVLPTIFLPKLRRFHLQGATFVDQIEVEAFFAANNALTRLHVIDTDMNFHVRHIVKHLTHLWEATFDSCFWYNLKAMQHSLQSYDKFTGLKRLRIARQQSIDPACMCMAINKGLMPVRDSVIRITRKELPSFLQAMGISEPFETLVLISIVRTAYICGSAKARAGGS